MSEPTGIWSTTSPAARRIAPFLASALGAGYLPTAGSLVAGVLGLGLWALFRPHPAWLQAGLFVLFCLLTIGLADWAGTLTHPEAPRFLAVHATAGAWAAILLLPRSDASVGIVALVLTRLLVGRQWFPLPIMACFQGGTGLVAPELVAGMLVNGLLRLLLLGPLGD